MTVPTDRQSDDFVVPRLPGLAHLATALEAADGEAAMLEGLAETAADALGYSIIINLRRPAWDDFEIAVVTGSQESGSRSLLGSRTSWGEWRDVLVERFRRGGAYFVPNGEYDWADDISRFVPERTYGDVAEAWQSGDELFLPLHSPDGRLQGILSLDEPASGLRPTDDDLRSLEAAGANIALGLELVHQAVEARRDRTALEQLMRMSTQLGRGGVEETLEALCTGIRDALGFQVVGAFLLDDPGRTFTLGASVGLPPETADVLARIDRERLEPLLTAAGAVQEGCVLVTLEQREALGMADWPFHSTLNGQGPHAWRRHGLWVALEGTAGELIGVVWADDPADRLLPGRAALQAMRTFANQAATGLEAGRHLGRLSHMAGHDPLTALRNRRGLLEEIEQAMAAAGTVSLLMCDMDHFKRINDRLGYAAGDEAIRRVGAILAAEAEDGGIAARLGGEEFALVLPKLADGEAAVVAARVRCAVAAAFEDYSWPQAVSVGVASSTAPGRPGDAASLLRLASRALLAAKRTGRDRFILYDPLVVEEVLGGMEQAGATTEATMLLIRLAESLDRPEAGKSGHSQAAASLAVAVATELGWSDQRVERMRLAGMLHDLGTLVMPLEILQKAGRLEAAEWNEIVRHPEAGARMLATSDLPDVADWVRSHHERPDGQGYPRGLMGHEIPIEARILSAVDAYEAMTSPRAYRAAMTMDAALAELERCSGSQFDAEVVEVLRSIVRRVGPSGPRAPVPEPAPSDRRSPPRVA